MCASCSGRFIKALVRHYLWFVIVQQIQFNLRIYRLFAIKKIWNEEVEEVEGAKKIFKKSITQSGKTAVKTAVKTSVYSKCSALACAALKSADRKTQ